jgi:hypothetical protein
MYFYVKKILGLPILDWQEEKIWRETDWNKYISFVSDAEMQIMRGENSLGINAFENVLFFEGIDERHVICWARCCIKKWFSEFGVNAARLREVLSIESLIHSGNDPDKYLLPSFHSVSQINRFCMLKTG